MRHEDWDENKLKRLIKEIQQIYSVLSVETLEKANEEHPEKFPSYKTFERKLGGIKNIKKNIGNY